jgi:zinc-ribbon domain
MRRLLVFAALLVGILIPTGVSAQGETIINELKIRLWPEYDRTGLLVIYDFSLAPGTTTPATLKFRVPLDAEVTAVAQQTQNGLFDVPFKSATEGNWQTITFNVSDQSPYRLEFYVPIQKQGNGRQFNFLWPGDYAVNTLVVETQEPPQTTGFTTTPALPNVESTTGGMPTHSGTFSSLSQGKQWALQASYSRATDDLTVSGQPVQPSGGTLDGNTTWSARLMDFLSRNALIILGVLGVLLIIAGVVWYWQASSSSRAKKGRRRHVSHGESASEAEQIYCPQCGKRAQPADKFCRACGSRLRREE